MPLTGRSTSDVMKNAPPAIPEYASEPEIFST
jgi:hypothetical protein